MYLKFYAQLNSIVEVELLWMQCNAPSVALRGACVSYIWQSLSDITDQLLAGHQSCSQWAHSNQAASAQLGYE